MQPDIEGVRRQLGELGALQAQCDRVERQILSIATEKLDALQSELEQARVAAMTGGDEAKRHYADLVMERGRLEIVIARARAVLP